MSNKRPSGHFEEWAGGAGHDDLKTLFVKEGGLKQVRNRGRMLGNQWAGQ